MLVYEKTFYHENRYYSCHPCETCPVLDTGAGVDSRFRGNDILFYLSYQGARNLLFNN